MRTKTKLSGSPSPKIRWALCMSTGLMISAGTDEAADVLPDRYLDQEGA